MRGCRALLACCVVDQCELADAFKQYLEMLADLNPPVIFLKTGSSIIKAMQLSRGFEG